MATEELPDWVKKCEEIARKYIVFSYTGQDEVGLGTEYELKVRGTTSTPWEKKACFMCDLDNRYYDVTIRGEGEDEEIIVEAYRHLG